MLSLLPTWCHEGTVCCMTHASLPARFDKTSACCLNPVGPFLDCLPMTWHSSAGISSNAVLGPFNSADLYSLQVTTFDYHETVQASALKLGSPWSRPPLIA